MNPDRLQRRSEVDREISFPSIDYDAWLTRVRSELSREGFEDALVATGLEGVPIHPLYASRPASFEPGAEVDSQGFPVFWSHLLGGRSLSDTESGWYMCQRAEHADIDVLNSILAGDFAGGASGVWLRFDRCARLGMDAGDLESESHIGVGGTSAYGLPDLDRAFRDLPLRSRVILMDAGANALPIATILLAFLDEQGIEPEAAEVAFGMDPLGAVARDGALPREIDQLDREMAVLVKYCSRTLPRARAVTVSTVPYHDAGASATQELAYAVASGVEYLRRLEELGVPLEMSASQLVFSLSVGSDLFIEIAKLRAVRLLWAKVLSGCGISDALRPVRIHAVTSGRTMTRRDPWVNMLRVTTQAFAAAIGGADAITTTGFDRALIENGFGEPSELGRRVARNTQSILALESHLGRVRDPAGGSFYIESLTNELAQAAWTQFQAVEAFGGMLDALSKGRVASEVAAVREIRAKALEDGSASVVGVTEFVDPQEEIPEVRAGSHDELCATAVGRVQCLRESRTCDPVKLCGELDFSNPHPGVDCLIRSAGCGATVGELSRALGGGTVSSVASPLPRWRDSQGFEQGLETEESES